MAELKPCPFCGGKVRFDKAYSYFRDSVIYCDDCDMVFTLDDCSAKDDEICEAWNNRADKVAKVAEYMRGFKNGLESVMKEECKEIITGLCESITEAVKNVIPFVMDKMEIKADLDMARWIPCSERLPEEETDVIAVIDGCSREAFYSDNSFTGSNFYRNAENVTYWMPMPEPPESGAQNEAQP